MEAVIEMENTNTMPDNELEQRYKRYKEILKNLTIMSDIFMRNVFKKRECVEYVLRIIMEKTNLQVLEQIIQMDYKNLQGRSAILDCVARDNEDKRYNEDSFRFIRDIETFMKEDFKTKLEQAYGSQWFKRGVPKAVYDKANQLASEKNYEITDASEEYSPWDCLTLIDYRRIATYGSNWRDIFEKYYTKPGEEKGGNKEAKTEWMQKLERIRNNNFHTYSVKEEEFEFLSELHKWLIETSD